jgi:hypothetical protein
MSSWKEKKREAAQRRELFDSCTPDSAANGVERQQNGVLPQPSWSTRRYTSEGSLDGKPTVCSSSWSRVQSRAGTSRSSPEGLASNAFVQKRMVHRAIQQHHSTTASAERSLQVAESCLDIGVTTLEEVARQGEQLDKAERDLDMVCSSVRPFVRLSVCLFVCLSVCWNF